MVEAMCWDLADNVTAGYAYANQDFSYFCPHPDCLQEVRPKQIVNAHFFAPGLHIAGCPNEPEMVENKDTTTRPAKKPSVVPPPAIPTELGPAKKRGGKRVKPTRSELLALAAALTAQPPRCAGTLLEVARAWQRMSQLERLTAQLLINGEHLTYDSAFYCVSKFGDKPIADLPCASRIVYGAVHLEKAEDCFWIKSMKTYKASDDRRLHLRIKVPNDNSLTAKYIENVWAAHKSASSFTLFYHGEEPALSTTGKSYGISKDISNDYQRFVVEPT